VAAEAAMVVGTESNVAVEREVSAGVGAAEARADCNSASACGARPACALTTFTQGAWPPDVRRAGFWLVKPASRPK